MFDPMTVVLATTTGEWVSRGAHLLAAMVAVGGLVMARVAVRPALDEAGETPVAEGIRRRWAPVVYTAITLLIATGFYQFFVAGIPKGETDSKYHMWFGMKFAAALAVFFIASAVTGRSRALEGVRRSGRLWLSLAILLAVGIVAVSLYLRSIVAAE